jgi:hypothetical protein
MWKPKKFLDFALSLSMIAINATVTVFLSREERLLEAIPGNS